MIEGGDESNMLTLLTSLANVCRNDESLFVTPCETAAKANEKNGGETALTSEGVKTTGMLGVR